MLSTLSYHLQGIFIHRPSTAQSALQCAKSATSDARLVTNVSPLSRSLNDTIERCFHQLWRPPGMALGVCDAEGLAWSLCLGERQLGAGTAIDEHTMFALASGTKTLAAASIAHLIGQHKLDWDTRVVDIDPAFDAGDARVTELLTLRDLACHRTGWTSSEGRHRAAAVTRADLVSRLRYHGFRHPFRESFAYCTDGFSALGHVVDKSTGISWERYAQSHLLAPLDMERTFFSVAEAEASNNFAQPHLQLSDGERVPVPWYYEDGVATPAGGANSCLADLSKWLGAWLANSDARTPWPTEQTVIMRTPQIADAGPFADQELSCAVSDDLTDEAYALGWYTHRYRGERIFHHTGSIRGFRAMLALLPERGLGFIALVNADAVYLPRALFQATLDALQNADPMRWIPDFWKLEQAWHSLNAGRYFRDRHDAEPIIDEDLVGAYRDDGRFGSIQIESNHIGLSFRAGRLSYRIVAAGGDSYRCEEPCGALVIDQGPLHVERNRSGQVVGFRYRDALFTRIG
jgi:CubicO group peptidase (beta-lactamase class C family)